VSSRGVPEGPAGQAVEGAAHAAGVAPRRELIRGLGLFDATMIVAGSMIGSGIYIVSADISRNVGTAGWLLLVWIVTGVLTLAGALSYGELAAMMPRAGGQYVYLREAFSPLLGFLYGWAFFLVIQTGTIAAVAVAFARFLEVFLPGISESRYLLAPVGIGSGYALSLSTQQLVAILLIVFLTAINTRGLVLGKTIQNVFTVAKTASLMALIGLGLTIGFDASAASRNFSDAWSAAGAAPIDGGLSAATSAFGLLVAFCIAQVGSLFSSDSWNNVTFTAGEVKDPRRTVPLALALGVGLVISLYFLANVAYLVILPIEEIRNAPQDRVGTAALRTMFGGSGELIMAAAIIVSTFGCNNGLVLSGARVYYAMARDGLLFRGIGELNASHVPSRGLILQGVWACLLVLPRTVKIGSDGAPEYGNLYSDLLDYVISTVLIFYILTVAGIFVLRRTRPDAERPYRAIGYPYLQLLYIAGASTILAMLMIYKPQMTRPGLLLVLAGIPVYFLWRRGRGSEGGAAAAGGPETP
jgi:APA family basic amino acid/polyamine antiporter